LELYAGYDYVRYHASPRIVGVPASESFNANSGSSQFVVNRNNWLGLVGEFTAYAVARQGFATTHEVSCLFGPRITLRRGRVTPFVHVLFGREWAEDGFTFGSVSAFAVAAGGGV